MTTTLNTPAFDTALWDCLKTWAAKTENGEMFADLVSVNLGIQKESAINEIEHGFLPYLYILNGTDLDIAPTPTAGAIFDLAMQYGSTELKEFVNASKEASPTDDLKVIAERYERTRGLVAEHFGEVDPNAWPDLVLSDSSCGTDDEGRNICKY